MWAVSCSLICISSFRLLKIQLIIIIIIDMTFPRLSSSLFFIFLSASSQLSISPVYSYNGQVYLIGTANRVYRGLLRVRLSDTFNAVCVDNFNMQAAIAVCRQLGYTNGTYEIAEA